jgi:uncharacterized Rossmann fold enzyme
MGEGINQASIAFQDQVRNHFGWSYEADVASAKGLLDACERHPKAQAFGWTSQQREALLSSLKVRLENASLVVLVGAAAERTELLRKWPKNTEFIAADGAVGACLGLVEPLCVVTDLDGGHHLNTAAHLGVPLVLHAHGDNQAAWASWLGQWTDRAPPVVLTHQTHEPMDGMLNPGGFTDGDRAVCFLNWLGIPLEKTTLLGYRVDEVGQWSGRTNPSRKLEKLHWMARILDEIHPSWRRLG